MVKVARIKRKEVKTIKALDKEEVVTCNIKSDNNESLMSLKLKQMLKRRGQGNKRFPRRKKGRLFHMKKNEAF